MLYVELFRQLEAVRWNKDTDILRNMSSLMARSFDTVQELNRFRKEVSACRPQLVG